MGIGAQPLHLARKRLTDTFRDLLQTDSILRPAFVSFRHWDRILPNEHGLSNFSIIKLITCNHCYRYYYHQLNGFFSVLNPYSKITMLVNRQSFYPELMAT